jgi:uncharacterized protein YdeI (YjbR/CyaY-like superfamily)
VTAPTFFATASEFRRWLETHHDTAREALVGFYKTGSARGGIRYKEALDAALCFGWIDGVRKRLDALSYSIRFTPRRPGSVWSNVNTKRAALLTKLGLMAQPGLRAFEGRDKKKSRRYSYESKPPALDAALEARLRAKESAWTFFESQPPGYRKIVTYWVMSAKKEETRARRLALLIKSSARRTRIDFMKPVR